MADARAPTHPLGWARPWATARPFARPMPRAGAWYRVVGTASADRAVLDIRGRRVAIAKRLLEIRPERPTSFTVVIRPLEAAAQAPVRRSDRIYAVCPACTARVRVHREQLAAVCPQCRHRGEVAWWETG